MKNKAEVQASASNALMQMTTKGWVTRIWDNLGWYWALENAGGLINVYQVNRGGKAEYMCMLTDDYLFLGIDSQLWDDDLAYADPNEAVSKKIEAAQDTINMLREIMTEVTVSMAGGEIGEPGMGPMVG